MDSELKAMAEVLCVERCAQAGDPPCSRVVPDKPHCDECLGMALAVLNTRAPDAKAETVAEILAWLRGTYCQLRPHPEDQAFGRHLATAIEERFGQ